MASRAAAVSVLTAVSACVIAIPPLQPGAGGQHGNYQPRSNTRWSDLGAEGDGAGRGQVQADDSARSFSREDLSVPEREPAAANQTGFRVVYTPSRDPGMDKIRQAFQAEQIFEKHTASLNGIIKMPTAVDIHLADCGIENAFYSPKDTRIVLCYEFIALLARTFRPHIKDDNQLGTAIIGTTFFVLFHEIGHALRHQLDLPVTGKEEDAVDQVATLILMSQGEEGVQAVLSSAYWFHLKGDTKTPDGKAVEHAFWDEHSLDQQRFYNIACLIYGADTKAGAFLVEKKILPTERAARCPGEYQQIASAWGRLLAPHRVNAGEVASAPPSTRDRSEPDAPSSSPKRPLDEAERLNQEGKRLFAADDLRAARERFMAAIERRAEPRYIYNLCLCELGLGRLEAARSVCETVLDMNPDARLAEKVRETLAGLERKRPQRRESNDERRESDDESEPEEYEPGDDEDEPGEYEPGEDEDE